MTEFEKKYYVERRGTGSAKWDGLAFQFSSADLLPFWVADMDFRVPECVQDALREMADFGVFGYYGAGPAYDQAIIDWEKRRHGYEIQREWLRFSPGVVAGIYRYVQAYTQKGDSCIILSPCYYPFMHAVHDNERKLVCSMLINNGGIYSIDYEDFEAKIVENDVKLFVLCSPHNPVGRVWTAEELKKLLEICKKHDVIVVSDEIHQDIIPGSRKHIPTDSVNDIGAKVVTLSAASKTFNLAALNHSFAIIPDEALRKQYDEACKFAHIGGAMPGYIATRAAYTGGEAWLEELLTELRGNAEFVEQALTKALPKVVVSPLEGTYLMWIDLGAYVKQSELQDLVETKCGLAVDYGKWFFDEGVGEDDCHIRVNLATSRANLEELTKRLIAAIQG